MNIDKTYEIWYNSFIKNVHEHTNQKAMKLDSKIASINGYM